MDAVRVTTYCDGSSDREIIRLDILIRPKTGNILQVGCDLGLNKTLDDGFYYLREWMQTHGYDESNLIEWSGPFALTNGAANPMAVIL